MSLTTIREKWVAEHGYTDYVEFPDGNNAVIHKLMFTYAILADLSEFSAAERWCYHDYDSAKAALDEWITRGGEGEPEGWHRHPATGRRRPEGDKNKEYVNW